MSTPTQPWYIVAIHPVSGHALRTAHLANGTEDNDRFDAAVAANPAATVILWRDLRVPTEWTDPNDVIDWGEDVLDDLGRYGTDRHDPARLHDPHGAYRLARALAVAECASDTEQWGDPADAIEALTEVLSYFINTAQWTGVLPIGATQAGALPPTLPTTALSTAFLDSVATTARLEALVDLPTALNALDPADYFARLVGMAREVHADSTYPDAYGAALSEAVAWVLSGRGPIAGQG